MKSLKKICVIGGGNWGINHIKTLSQIEALGGIVESNTSRLNELLQKYPEAKGYEKVEDAVKDGYDGFVVATPVFTHFDIGKYLIGKKQNVLIEKPMALSSEHTKKLIELADEHKVRLMVGHVLLFHPAMRKIKEVIDEGKIGKLQYIYSNRLNLGTVRTEENVFWSFAPHDISIFDFFIGQEPTEISSSGGAFLQDNIHDITLTSFSYPNNIKAHIFVSWLHPFKEHRIVVIGEKGMISFEDSSDSKEIIFYDKGINWANGLPIKREGETSIIEYEKSQPLENELKYFIENLDGEIKLADGRSGHEVVKVLEKVNQSLQSGQTKKTESEKKYFVHESAYVDDGVEIDEGTKIWHFSHIQTGSKIGKNCSIGQNVNVANNAKIGNNVKIQNNVSVYEGVELEDYVFCGPSMVFTNVKQPRCKYPQRGGSHYLKTLLKEGASIGANATIVCGHTIGKHAFIAAGAVVASDVPDYAIMMGVPAKQKGWACECGEQLDATLVCKRCSKKYIEEKQTLREV